MKKLMFSLLVLPMAMIATAQKGPESTPYMTKEFSASSIKLVESTTSGGNISVSGTASGQAKVEVFIHSGNSRKDLSRDEIQHRLNEDYEVKVEMSGQKLVASAKPKKRNMNWNNSLSISFVIYVAKNTETNLTTSGGNINLDELTGRQDFTTSGGNLKINKLSGDVKGRTSGGNITVQNSDNKLNLTTSGGNIHAENCNGELKLSTSGGSIDLTALKGNIDATTSGGNVRGSNIAGELEAHTSGGNVRLENLSCDINASTSGGNVSVAVTTPGKFVKLSNSGGSISLVLPANKGYDMKISGDRVKTENLANFKGDIEEDEIEGAVNGGGTAVTVRASSGRVNVSMK